MDNELLDQFCGKFVEAYKQADYTTLKELLHSKSAPQIYLERGMDLLHTICIEYKDESLLTPEKHELSEILILQIIEHAKPKESLIALLEQLETFGATSRFCFFLKPIQKVLLKYEFGKRIVSLEWVFETIREHVRVLKLPNYTGMNEKERKLIDCSKETIEITDMMRHIVIFFDPFVSEVCVHKELDIKLDLVVKAREVLANGILAYLNDPLIHLDLHATTDCSPKVMKYVRQLLKLLAEVKADFLKLIVYRKSKDKKDLWTEQMNLCGANLFYLLMSEDVTVFLPLVYSSEFLLEHSLPFVNELLKIQKDIVNQKGLLLLKSLVIRIPERRLTSSHFSLRCHTSVFTALRRIAVYSEMEDVRKLALEVFQKYLGMFSLSAQFTLLKSVLKSESHSGIKGFAIGLIKERVRECLRAGTDEFLGVKFAEICSEVFKLQNGVETDLLENSDHILASLNVLRYFLLVDVKDQVGLKSLLLKIDSTFLSPLQKALDLSKAHYELKVKELKEGRKADELPCEVVVCGQKLEAMPLQMQAEVVKQGITTFDLIHSVLARTNECINAFRSQK